MDAALRALLQPVTHRLPDPVYALGQSLLGHACYRALVLDVAPVANPACVRLGASKALGIAIVTAAAVVKLTQIVKLVRARSARSLSALAYLLETAALLITLAYNVRNGFPFSTYGESALIFIQDVAICLLILNYTARRSLAALLIALLAVSLPVLFSHSLLRPATMSYLQVVAGFLGVASKLPQIVAIWQQGGTGQLSAFAVFNYLFGSLSRIFATLQEVDDKLILYGFIAGFTLNAVLALQMLYYWNVPSEKTEGKRLKTPMQKLAVSTATPTSTRPTTRRRG